MIREQAKKELATMNNVKMESEKTKKSRGKFNKKSKNNKSNSASSENKKLENKRLKRYHERVWRGWRESDGQSSPVKTFHIDDLES